MTEEADMDCERALELLPWLAGGGLARAEAQLVQRHLGTCAACRAEFDETLAARDVFAAHVPTSALVELAWDRPTALSAELIESHLARCVACAEDLRLVRESRRLESTEPSLGHAEPAQLVALAPATRRRPVWLRYGALAAGFCAAAFSGAVWREARDSARWQSVEREGAAAEAAVARLEAELRELRARSPATQAKPAQPQPQLDLPVVELLPTSLTSRSTQPAVNEVTLPAGAAWAAVLLQLDGELPGPAMLELRAEGGAVVWRAEGLRAGPLGAISLGLPAALIPAGRYTIDVRAGQHRQTYRLRVRQTPASVPASKK